MPFLEYFLVYLLGALGYGCIETLWRGWTHWTMLLTGGACLLLIYWIANFLPARFGVRWCLCGAGITAVEYLVGLLVNVQFGWDIWDYSHMAWNLSGQICLRFSLYWTLLALPFLFLCRGMHWCIALRLKQRATKTPRQNPSGQDGLYCLAHTADRQQL